MAGNLSDVSAVDALMKRGKTTMNSKWTDGVPDYASEYSLTAEHIPALIEAATNYTHVNSIEFAQLSCLKNFRATEVRQGGEDQ